MYDYEKLKEEILNITKDRGLRRSPNLDPTVRFSLTPENKAWIDREVRYHRPLKMFFEYYTDKSSTYKKMGLKYGITSGRVGQLINRGRMVFRHPYYAHIFLGTYEIVEKSKLP